MLQLRRAEFLLAGAARPRGQHCRLGTQGEQDVSTSRMCTSLNVLL